jgi:hypothetical protein
MDAADKGSRIGASYAAGWIAETVKTMEAEGEHSRNLASRPRLYMNILVDWREEQVEMPKGNP